MRDPAIYTEFMTGSKDLILTVSLADALTMTASANGNEVSRAKTLVAYFSFPIDSFIAFGNAGAPLLSLARLLAMGFNLLDCPFIVAGTGTYKIGT